MAEEYNRKSQEEMNTTTPVEVETKDRGMFDFLGRMKVEEKKPAHDGGYVEEEVIASEFEEKLAVSDKPDVEEKKHHSLLEQMHRSDSPVPVEKKGFLERMMEKLPGQNNKEEDQVVAPPPQVKYEAPFAEVPPPLYQDEEAKEKKGIVEKVKEKLPGQHKNAENLVIAPSPYAEVPPPQYQDEEGYEKKGIVEKVKEKLPGQHKNAEDQVIAPPPVKYEVPYAEVPPQYQDDEGYERKGIVEKAREKLPGPHKKADDQEAAPPPVKYEAHFAEVPQPQYQDGEGEEKKGIVEKVREKLPGQHKKAEVPPPQYQDDEGYEKKGIVEKLKEKLPGQHNNFKDQVVAPPPPPVKYEAPYAEVPLPSYQDSQAEEKKGIMEKIKEGLPAQHKNAEDRETYAPPPPVKYEAPLAEVSPPLYQDGEKKDILEKMKENFPGQHNKAENQEANPLPPPVAYEAPPAEVPPPQLQDGEVEGVVPTPEPEVKKGFLVKMKEKLPGHHKKAENQVLASPPPPSSLAYEAPSAEVPPPLYQVGEAKEKKGIMEKIKEKLPGHHPKFEEDKEKEY